MKNIITVLLSFFKRKQVAKIPAQPVRDVKVVLRPTPAQKPVSAVTPQPAAKQTVTVSIAPVAAEPTTLKKKRYYKPKPKKSND